MKRIGNLYKKIISVENLRLADEKARKGKLKSYGVRIHDKNREANIEALHEALQTKTYKTSQYEVFTIFEPKERLIFRLPYYPDRIVHHAIMNILEPVWMKTFTHNTYSCIRGRGIEGCARAVDRIIGKYKEKPHLYCLKIDIRKFYPSIDHDVLKKIIRRKIKDEDLLWLLDEIIDNADGLPIGNYLSQYLANLYLSPLMHLVNETLHLDATEYADDIVFFGDSKEKLRNVFDIFINPYIRNELKLEVKSNYQIFPVAKNRYDKSGRALDYIGYKFFREQRLMRKSIKQNFCRKVARLNKLQIDVKAYKQEVAPWLGWAGHCNARNLLRKIIKQNYYGYCLLRKSA